MQTHSNRTAIAGFSSRTGCFSEKHTLMAAGHSDYTQSAEPRHTYRLPSRHGGEKGWRIITES